jgi:hypothetical protein
MQRDALDPMSAIGVGTITAWSAALFFFAGGKKIRRTDFSPELLASCLMRHVQRDDLGPVTFHTVGKIADATRIL